LLPSSRPCSLESSFSFLQPSLFAPSLRLALALANILAVAPSVGFPPYRATFFGPYSHLLGIRVSGWSTRFEECMVASAKAQELEEDLASVKASVGDLIGAKD